MPNFKEFETPTDSEFKIIREYLLKPEMFEKSDVGVLRHIIANNAETEFQTYIPISGLKRFELSLKGKNLSEVKNFDSNQKEPVYLNFYHSNLYRALPFGQAFDGYIERVEGREDAFGGPLYQVVGKFYTVSDGAFSVPLGDSGFFSNAENVIMDSKDLAKLYNGGLLPNGSVGFESHRSMCSVCGKASNSDDKTDCDHVLGSEYDGVKCLLEIGVSEVGGDSDIVLREYSFVPFGAIPDAGAKRESESEIHFQQRRNIKRICYSLGGTGMAFVEVKAGNEKSNQEISKQTNQKDYVSEISEQTNQKDCVSEISEQTNQKDYGSNQEKPREMVNESAQADLINLAKELGGQAERIKYLEMENNKLKRELESFNVGSLQSSLGCDLEKFMKILREDCDSSFVKFKGQNAEKDFSSLSALELLEHLKDNLIGLSSVSRGMVEKIKSNSRNVLLERPR